MLINSCERFDAKGISPIAIILNRIRHRSASTGGFVSKGSEYLVIQIVNWEKYQADAKRYKKPDWFRLDAKIIDHALWDTLSPTEFKFFIMILALTMLNGHQNGMVTTSFRSLARHLSVKSVTKPSQIKSVLTSLCGLRILDYQIVNIREMADFCRLRNGTERNGTEQAMADAEAVLPPGSVPVGNDFIGGGGGDRKSQLPPETVAFLKQCKPPVGEPN